MASTNGSHSSFLTPARSASSGGIRVFDVGDALPLSADQKAKLSAVLARIIERYPAEATTRDTISAEEESTESETSDDTAH